MRRARTLNHFLRTLLLLCGICLLLRSGVEAGWAQGLPAAGSGAGAPFGVRSAFLKVVEDVYLLTARLHLPVDPQLREALDDGVPLKLSVEMEVSRARSYWLDESVATLVQQYELRYHAVSDRYVVRSLNSGEQFSFPSLEAALEYLTHINSLPVLDRALVQKDLAYEARLRATLDVGDTPAALRWVMFWSDRHRVSEWYPWSVPQP